MPHNRPDACCRYIFVQYAQLNSQTRLNSIPACSFFMEACFF
ncbi:hypothetical protein HMPREF1548_03987 [Clostridium sp. KLE 1755]|nr:hypothetical protein HMPREF1548_03987 [Clostridium sp. KLE 1755]